MKAKTIRQRSLFSVFSGFVLLCLSLSARAEVKTKSDYLAEGWTRSLYLPFVTRLSEIPTMAESNPIDQAKCDAFYSKVRQSGEMKILFGVGYYDFSEGVPFSFKYYPDGSSEMVTGEFEENSTFDPAIVKTYSLILKSPCKGSLQFCGFDEKSPGLFTKMVQTQQGNRIRATIDMRSPSVTESHEQNVGPLKAEQTSKSAEVSAWFFDGIQNADLVVYNGHARKGGGPDFSPPRLLKNKHPNYEWYRAHTPGLSRLVSALKAAPVKPAALMLMSCNSTKLFERQVLKAAPGMAYSSTNLVPLTGMLPAKGTMAGVDSFLRMQCQSGLAKEFTVDADMHSQLKPLSIP